MDITKLLIMIPVFFIAGVLGRFVLDRSLKAPPKHRTKKRIKRDYFDVAPCANPEHEHSPDDDTHSVILEVIEKHWWKADVWKKVNDPLESIIGLFPPILILISLMGICNRLTHADNPTENLMAWEEKLLPYYIPIFITCIAISLTWIIASWLNKKLCLRKAVRNRNYTCELRTTEKALCNTAAALEVYESNAADFVHINIHFYDKAYRSFHTPIMLKVERTPLRES